MRWALWGLVPVFLLGCSGPGNFEAGGFDVDVVDIGTFYGNPLWLEVVPSGDFRGAQTGDLRTCSGSLTSTEHDELSDALDASYPPGPRGGRGASDTPRLRLEGTFHRGPMAGESFRFDVDPFAESSGNRVWDAVLAPLIRSEETGGCTP
ncbi:MAG: hypothetical protein JRH11_14850 [Deltaproteobacteria bacterium]|nr:hypothetical protein [Deltaproteobacteria bacterium]